MNKEAIKTGRPPNVGPRSCDTRVRDGTEKRIQCSLVCYMGRCEDLAGRGSMLEARVGLGSGEARYCTNPSFSDLPGRTMGSVLDSRFASKIVFWVNM